MGVISTHQLSQFSSPVNGTSPVDANQVRGNDNSIRSSYNAHDADPTVHLQTGLVASRPAPSLAGSPWLATDSGAVYLYADTGSAWVEVNYLRSTGGTITGNLVVTGTLGVTGATTLSSTLAVTGAVTGGTYNGQTITSAASFTGSVTVANGLTVTGVTTLNGDVYLAMVGSRAIYVGTSVNTSVNAGEAVLANAKALRGVIAAGTDTYAIVTLDSSNRVALGQTGVNTITLGTLTVASGLAVTVGGATISGGVTISNTGLTVAAGTTTLQALNAAATTTTTLSATALTVTTSGATITGGVTVSTGDIVATAGNFKLNAAASKIIPGATSLSLRNNVDSADNLLVTDAGAITVRSTISGVTTLTATTFSGALSGNATTATTLQTARAINGVNFDGSAAITVTAAAGTLTGSALASGVTASSLTSVGTLTSLAVTNDTQIVSGRTYSALGTTASIANGATAAAFTLPAGGGDTMFFYMVKASGTNPSFSHGVLTCGNNAGDYTIVSPLVQSLLVTLNTGAGNTVGRTVSVTNNTGSSQTIYWTYIRIG